MKNLHKVLKVASWMYMIDFLHNRVRPHSLKKGVSNIFYVILKGVVHPFRIIFKHSVQDHLATQH